MNRGGEDPGSSFKARMAQEISAWRDTGLISEEQAGLLQRRYDPRPLRGALVLKWLGLFAVFMLGISFLSLIGTVLASWSPLFAAACLLVVALGVLYKGAGLAADRDQKLPFTAQALLTLGLVGFYAALVSLYFAADGDRFMAVGAWFLLLTSGLGLLVAYRYHLRWPLLMALLMLFHGIGSLSRYGGHGAYYLSIQDPRTMAVVALVAISWGLWHEHELEENSLRRDTGFGGLYQIFGLVYLNLSLWILSLERQAWTWVVIFSVACVLQVVAGARRKDSRLTGFGIVFLGIDLYTRFYEFYWDSLSKALFFTIAGIWALVLGYLFERRKVKAQIP